MIHYENEVVRGGIAADAAGWRAIDALIPPDKSISHRALLFAALAPDPVVIRGLNGGKAVTLLLDALRQLGVDLTYDPGERRANVNGSLRAADFPPDTSVYLGPSSAAARLLMGALTGLGKRCIVDGDATLRARPFDWIVEPLTEMGGRFEYLGEPGALPIRIHASEFSGGCVETRIGSAQAVSAALFAGIAGRRAVRVRYPVRARDHTQLMAASFGDDVAETGNEVAFSPRAFSVPAELVVPKDPSALAYPAALFLLRYRNDADATVTFTGVCLNPTRLGFFDWLAQCGFDVRTRETGRALGEAVGDVILRGGGDARATDLGSKERFHAMIDEVPLAAAVCCVLPGRAVFRDLFELTFKESDRITATRTMLAGLGLRVDIDGYDMHVPGGQTPGPGPAVPSFGDHRLSMTAQVLLSAHALAAEIDEGRCYRTSFPEFGDCLRVLKEAA
ncbi:3-phosphoshikimate 1-carboxyvinyltransferase [Burkholderia sp. JP2-270]|uniref:3-phosphoshikimate 1-carboxyvinyltransferase n=1 Tax=Burkholderia sp. JP2-270 TaxID=2217913 RepID=UPI000DA2EA5D|nr:3-phosphoshikimate 1-carboxyvinyltransferase [Burkholderia sp. JP2-270]AWV02722.1 3-phosphoshikimate 1-carboxyvinyltransferase [Burkholderia sp. JP2-270]